jgi:hypothetical protein
VGIIDSRYGEGIPREDYINIEADYRIGRLKEGPSALELASDPQPKGMIVDDGGDEISVGKL